MDVRITCLILPLLFSVCSTAAQPSLSELRTLYLSAVENRTKSQEFMSYMNSVKHDDALMRAYYASAVALVSKHASGPMEKMKHLKIADKAFEEAVAKNPRDAEVRFLRFSVQLHLPHFLGYSDDLEADINDMLKNISATPSVADYPAWLATVVEFMIDSGECSAEQIAQFKALLK